MKKTIVTKDIVSQVVVTLALVMYLLGNSVGRIINKDASVQEALSRNFTIPMLFIILGSIISIFLRVREAKKQVIKK